MKFNPTTVFCDLSGGEILEGEQPLTYGRVAINSLLHVQPDAQSQPTGEEKVKRFALAQRIHAAGGEIEVKTEEATLIKQSVAKIYAPIIVGPLWQAFDG